MNIDIDIDIELRSLNIPKALLVLEKNYMNTCEMVFL